MQDKVKTVAFIRNCTGSEDVGLDKTVPIFET